MKSINDIIQDIKLLKIDHGCFKDTNYLEIDHDRRIDNIINELMEYNKPIIIPNILHDFHECFKDNTTFNSNNNTILKLQSLSRETTLNWLYDNKFRFNKEITGFQSFYGCKIFVRDDIKLKFIPDPNILQLIQ